MYVCMCTSPIGLPANYLPSLFLSIALVGDSFFPTFAEEIFVYYILADLENKVLHQFGDQIFST